MKQYTTEIFCICDDFFKAFSKEFDAHSLPSPTPIKLNPSARMSLPEMMTLLIEFHLSGYHDFKHFYHHAQALYRKEFPQILSYSRFIELIPSVTFLLYALAVALRGACTGESYCDATALMVCKNKRISGHRVFKNIAKRGKTSMGWFYGFKLHLVINNFGHILAFTLSPGNVDDRAAVPQMVQEVFGKLFGDKGYIGKDLFKTLWDKGIKMITSIRSNMKPQIMALDESEALGRRSLIESVFNVLKNSCRIEHSRHRSPANFVANLLAGLCAYMCRFLIGTGPFQGLTISA
jgi:hypothetical protein